MASSSTSRVKAFRKRLYEDEDGHEEAKKKDRERKRLKRMEIKKSKLESIQQKQKNTSYQKTWRAKKKSKDESAASVPPCKHSPQVLGKAYSRAMKTMPKSPTKVVAVVDRILYEMSPTKRTSLLQKHIKVQPHDRKKRSDALTDDELKEASCFYERNDISYLLPGKKDYKSVKTAEGKRVHFQKRVLLYNLKEVYSLYLAEKEEKENSMGFTKFASLRPQHVVLSSQRDQEVCMCEYHENLNLCAEGLRKVVPKLSVNISELLNKTLCSFDNEDCIDRKCEFCGVNALDADFYSISEDTPVVFFQWTTRDGHVKKEMIETDLFEGKEILKEQMSTFARHSYNAKWQHANLRHLKDSLKAGEIIIQEDFAENYALKQQNEIMKAHWSPEQVTVFTAVVYHKVDQELKHISYAIVSNAMTHGKKEVFVFNKVIITDLEMRLGRIEHIHYWSDGCSSQFKNKFNLRSNLMYHKADHGCTASWNFFATSHGKGPVDGIGAEVKRSVWRCTLQKKDVPVDAADFCKIAKREAKAINVLFVPESEVEETAVKFRLEERWKMSKSIPDMRVMHYFYVSDGEVFAEVNSKYINKSQGSTSIKAKVLESRNIAENVPFLVPSLKEGTWISVLFNNDWWPGQVIKVMLKEGKLQVKFPFKPVARNKFKAVEKIEFEEIALGTHLAVLPGDPHPIDSSARFFAYDQDTATKVASVIATIEQQ